MTGGAVYNVFLIYGCVALVATVLLALRQPLIVAYIVTGILVGPLGLGLITDSDTIDAFASFGILFLLFLMGMEMNAKELVRQLRRSFLTVMLSSSVFFSISYWLMLTCGYSQIDSFVVGVSMIFSSTVITLKLIPAKTLYSQHLGQLLVGILLLQDLLAVVALLVIQHIATSTEGIDIQIQDLLLLFYLPVLVAACFWFSDRVLQFLLSRYDLEEYAFLIAIAWCLGVAHLAGFVGLSEEIGAFLAGLSIAMIPIARRLDDSLRPLRDFFLILFFFAIGAGLDTVDSFNTWESALSILIPTTVLVFMSVAIKSYIFEIILLKTGEKKPLAANAGVRLAQGSEFGLLVGWTAYSYQVFSSEAMVVLQLTILVSIVISSTWVVLKFRNPMSLDEMLHRD